MQTPVWFARRGERLYVFTESDAGKVKRLRNGPRARVAACNALGRLRGDWIEARGRVVDDPGTERDAYAALRAKYGWQMTVVDFFSRLAGRIDNARDRRDRARRVTDAICSSRSRAASRRSR